MRDLTQGSINRHLVAMAAPVMAGMVFQTLYILVDLYFVGRLGNAAIAGVGAAGSVMLAIMAVTQSLGVGAVALISQAVGRKQQADANLVFNQTLSLSLILMIFTLALLYLLTPVFAAAVSADAETRRLAALYLYAFIPAMALQFLLVSLGSALRGTGIVKPAMVVQVLTVVLNIILAPVLISGWGTGVALGVTGAGLASSIAIAIGVTVLWLYFHRLEHYVAVARAQLRPQLAVWWRILAIGLPAGGEFIVMFLIWSCNYWVLRQLGAEAQAGFSVGQRVFQSLFLPAMAVAFSVSPIVGQNWGARHLGRVRQTYSAALRTSFIAVLPILAICQVFPAQMVAVFSNDPGAIAIGVEYLRYCSWVLIFGAVTSISNGVLQGVGNTWPGLLCSASRVISFILPAAWLSTRPGFNTREVWIATMLASLVNAVLIALFLRTWFRRHPATAAT
jgi:putative MATE family efflux protein